MVLKLHSLSLSLFFKFLKKIFKAHPSAFVGLIGILFFVFVAIIGPFFVPFSENEMIPNAYKLPPLFFKGATLQHLLGTDDLGRDIFSRLVLGSRISLFIGIAVVFLASFLGTFLGLLAGHFGGLVDKIIMQIVYVLMSLPSILLAIVIVSLLGPGIFNAIVAVSVVAMPAFIRIVRGSVLLEKEKLYVKAAKTFGAGHLRIMFKEILPNCMAPLMVQVTLGVSDAILNTAALGFLGLGARPPLPEWGLMLADGRQYLESVPHLVVLPGLCLVFVVLSLNLLGDGLRDILDPKFKKK